MAINRDKVLEAAQKYVEKKKYDKAVQEYQKLIDADPNDARTLLKIGDLQAKQFLHADAISTYETVGKLYAHQGFALKAIAVYKQIREIIAKHVPQLEERYGHITPKLAELYQQLGLTSDALAALDEVATRLQRQQRDQEAIEVFRKIVELDPTNPLPHLRLAEALSRVKDTDGAVFEFKTAASQLAGIGRRDDALKVLERLLHHKPDAEQARICAELYLSRGQPQDGMQALSKLQICFQANPRDFDTLSLLARAFNTIGQGTKAIEVQKEMARVARDAGKQDLFREIVERLMRVAPQDDGVRKLASQSGSASQVGSASAVGVGTGTGQNPAYTQAQPPYPQPYGQQQPPPMPASQPRMQGQPPPLQRPQTNDGAFSPQQNGQHPSLPRPTTAAQFPPSMQARAVAPAPSSPEIETSEAEIDELSYEEVEPDDSVEAQAEEPSGGTDVEADAYEANEYAEQDYEEAALLQSEAPDDAPAPPSGTGLDVSDQIHKALADANAFRRVRLYNKALDTLRGGLEIDPRSMDIHEVYRDILIESGQTEDAVLEMLVIAALYVDSLDGESAARALQDVLAFDPQNARAIEMLQELGYEIVDENGEGAPAPQYEEEQSADQGELPSYELEESHQSARPANYASDRQVYVGRGGSEAAAALGEELPSFPLDEPDAGYDAPAHAAQHDDPLDDHDALGLDGNTVRPAAPPEFDQDYYNDINDEPAAEPMAAAPAAPQSAAAEAPVYSARSSRELEDALDEAEFFCSRGLFDDARAILAEQLGKHPKHPLLRERIAELDAQDEERAGSGARERPRATNAANGANDHAYDIAASLDALEGLDYGALEPAEGHAQGNEQVDVEEVFAKFKEGVAKQISVDDSDSHYNLGIAYKEMMLIDDAIREFETAAQDPKRECVCRSMIGMIEIERGRMNEAIDAFLLGLNSPNKDPQQETVLCYEIGACYEAKKMNKEALSYYQKAMRRDPNYRDVQERVRRLAKGDARPMRAAVGADDEFDRAFDDLVSKA